MGFQVAIWSELPICHVHQVLGLVAQLQSIVRWKWCIWDWHKLAAQAGNPNPCVICHWHWCFSVHTCSHMVSLLLPDEKRGRRLCFIRRWDAVL